MNPGNQGNVDFGLISRIEVLVWIFADDVSSAFFAMNIEQIYLIYCTMVNGETRYIFPNYFSMKITGTSGKSRLRNFSAIVVQNIELMWLPCDSKKKWFFISLALFLCSKRLNYITVSRKWTSLIDPPGFIEEELYFFSLHGKKSIAKEGCYWGCYNRTYNETTRWNLVKKIHQKLIYFSWEKRCNLFIFIKLTFKIVKSNEKSEKKYVCWLCVWAVYPSQDNRFLFLIASISTREISIHALLKVVTNFHKWTNFEVKFTNQRPWGKSWSSIRFLPD